MKVFRGKIDLESKKLTDFIDVTDQVQKIIDESGIREGTVMVYAPHSTMSVVVNHNEPMLIQDFVRTLHRIIPIEDQYSHDLFEIRKGRKSDGRSNGHSHCKALLLGLSKFLPIEKGRLIVTEKQSLMAVDFDGPRKRDLVVQVMGI